MNLTDLSIIAPAFFAGFAVLLSHVPLGREVLKRGIIFIDLAIAQIAGLGIILASFLGFETHGWELQLIALMSALAGAFVLSSLENIVGRFQEAVIGITFVLSASAAIILLAHNPQGGEHLKELLVGQILWVEWTQILLPAFVGIVVLMMSLLAKNIFSGKLFYYIFAIAITMSVQLVGVYLVFASLILPALSVVILSDHKAMLVGVVIGSFGYLTGLLLSSVLDLPSGALIVWMLALFSLIAVMLIKVRSKAGKS